MKYEYKEKPKKCPVCGSERIANIVYGYLDFTKQLEKEIEEGKIALGGCLVELGNPLWQCADCGTRLYFKFR
ncbi:MAG TPA: hypothetical protein ENK44_00780 [Caldithrix abyssi]|uniref:Uncharacterized protein n=1 Tax=Caldithrix abyssi TaxID=187145 RepID=A0A7V4TXP7_CALAY|nr:hypothetical protein [Caldithrix abyssi]